MGIQGQQQYSSECSDLISLDWLVWYPCIPSNSQESSPAPQFESIYSSALDLLNGPILTFKHEYWKSNSFDYINISQKKVMPLLIIMLVYIYHSFLFKEKVSFNLMATITIHSDFQFSSVTQSCPALCDSTDCSTPGLPVYHQLPEFTQTHVRWVSDAIQPSHLLSYPSPPAFNHSQHQGLFQWVSSSHQVAKVLEFQLQHQPF